VGGTDAGAAGVVPGNTITSCITNNNTVKESTRCAWETETKKLHHRRHSWGETKAGSRRGKRLTLLGPHKRREKTFGSDSKKRAHLGQKRKKEIGVDCQEGRRPSEGREIELGKPSLGNTMKGRLTIIRPYWNRRGGRRGKHKSSAGVSRVKPKECRVFAQEGGG